MNRRGFLKNVLANSVAVATGTKLTYCTVSASSVHLAKFIIDKDTIRIYDEKGTLRIAYLDGAYYKKLKPRTQKDYHKTD